MAAPEPGRPIAWLLALENLDQGLAEASRRRRHADARGLHGGDLVLSTALAAGDDRTGVAHAASGRSRAAGDEADHRLLAALLGLAGDEGGRLFLGRAADLADHDDRLGLGIGEEHVEHLDELGALHRIA